MDWDGGQAAGLVGGNMGLRLPVEEQDSIDGAVGGRMRRGE